MSDQPLGKIHLKNAETDFSWQHRTQSSCSSSACSVHFVESQMCSFMVHHESLTGFISMKQRRFLDNYSCHVLLVESRNIITVYQIKLNIIKSLIHNIKEFSCEWGFQTNGGSKVLVGSHQLCASRSAICDGRQTWELPSAQNLNLTLAAWSATVWVCLGPYGSKFFGLEMVSGPSVFGLIVSGLDLFRFQDFRA